MKDSKCSNQEPNHNKQYGNLLISLQHIIFDLKESNIDTSVKLTLDLFDGNYPYSFSLTICQLIYFSFMSQQKNVNIYLSYLKLFDSKEIYSHKLKNIFIQLLLHFKSQESYYLLEMMIEQKLADPIIFHDSKDLYFAQHMTNTEIAQTKFKNKFWKKFFENIEELQKEDWKLQKKLVKDGVNPNEIVNVIRNDEIEKLQEISSKTNFDFNQIIEPSLYEKCTMINQNDVSLIDYAAFFGSIKCFKFLMLNGSNLISIGKYAVAGGNLEIIHLCEQNHSLFKDAYETAIEYHQNNVFHYLYENKIIEIDDLTELGKKCVIYNNYEIFSFLEDEKMIITNELFETFAKCGNLYLIKHFTNGQINEKLFFLAIESGNYELVKYIQENGKIDLNKIYVLF